MRLAQPTCRGSSRSLSAPVERWLFPEAHQYLIRFPPFVAATLWIPPGCEPDAEAIIAALTRSVAPEQHHDTFSVLEQMDGPHPSYPHWYVPWLGVD